jgi:hypothetical protein
VAVQEKLVADFPRVPDYPNELAGTLVNRAIVKNAAREHARARALLEKAREYHRQALRADPTNDTYRQFFRNNRQTMGEALLGLGDHAEAAAEAEELARFGYEPANAFYRAAGLVSRCIPLAEKDAGLPEARRGEVARRYGERAVAFLRQAVQAGFKNAAGMKKDSALAALRGRADFRELLAGLEGKGNKRATPGTTTP